MKGQYSLYDNLIFQPIEPAHSKPNLARRADAIAHRYYYYGSICRMLYEDCLHHLHLEFFLEPDTIYNELKKRTALVSVQYQQPYWDQMLRDQQKDRSVQP